MRPECARAAAAYALALPRAPFGGTLGGERLGRGIGSSLEFMDFRDYLPGDDLRHVDWRSYARTDQMKVRLYREEVAPALDVVVDVSRSMAVSARKEQAARDLCDALDAWNRGRTGGRGARLWAAGGGQIDGARLRFDGERDAIAPEAPLRARSLRAVVGDFLLPLDPLPALRRVASSASHLWVIQLLDPWEADPTREGARTLIDAEDDARLELVLDEGAVAGYRERLVRLQSAVARATRALGGTYALVVADEPEVMFRRGLLAHGVVEAR